MAPKGYALTEAEARDFNRMRAERRRLGPPKARRQPRRRRHGGGGGTSITGAIGSAWTVTEYEPITGEMIRTFYRTSSRTTAQSDDYDCILTSGGSLFANGSTNINADNGIGVLFDAATGDLTWKADRGALSAVTSLLAAYSVTSFSRTSTKHVLEAADGFLWLAGIGSITRIDPSDGAMTHRVITLGGVTTFLLPCSTSGSIVCRPGSSADSDRISVISDAGARTHGFSTITPIDVDEGGGVLAVTNGTTLTTLNSSDLSVIATGTVAGSDVRSVCTDGTNVWVMCNDTGAKTKKFAVNDITTEIFSVAGLTTTVAGVFFKFNPITGAIYAISGTQMRKIDPATGAVTWTSAALGTSPLTIARHMTGFGSDFVLVANDGTGSGSSGANIFCLNDSDGTTRWSDFVGGGVSYTGAAHNVFACGVHVNAADDRIFVSHAKKTV